MIQKQPYIDKKGELFNFSEFTPQQRDALTSKNGTYAYKNIGLPPITSFVNDTNKREVSFNYLGCSNTWFGFSAQQASSWDELSRQQEDTADVSFITTHQVYCDDYGWRTKTFTYEQLGLIGTPEITVSNPIEDAKPRFKCGNELFDKLHHR